MGAGLPDNQYLAASEARVTELKITALLISVEREWSTIYYWPDHSVVTLKLENIVQRRLIYTFIVLFFSHNRLLS